MKLKIEGLDYAYTASNHVLKNITMEAIPGKITAIIGPNASGKSTLIRCVAGLLNPTGTIEYINPEGLPMPRTEAIKHIGYLPQEIPSRVVLTVFEAVLLGRLKKLSWIVKQEDLEKTDEMLKYTGIESLASRFLSELSGGQKQIVSIAQTLVSEPEIILFDEPISNLDLRHEIEMLELIRSVTKARTTATMIAIHNLSLTIRYADKLVVLKEGQVYASGLLEDVMTPKMVQDVFGVNVNTVRNNGFVHIIPVSPRESDI